MILVLVVVVVTGVKQSQLLVLRLSLGVHLESKRVSPKRVKIKDKLFFMLNDNSLFLAQLILAYFLNINFRLGLD